MTQYPAFDDYQAAIGLPSRFFSDPEIKVREAVRVAGRSAANMPMPEYSAGRYAITFKFARPDLSGPLAVRCFKIEIPDLMDRYRAIQAFLGGLRSAFFVDFAVSGPDLRSQTQGVLVNGQWLPVMRMAWVDGKGFGAAIRDRVNDPAALGTLRDQVGLYSEETERRGFAHGDIHPDNIIVSSSSQLVMVDYDGLFVPALAGRDSPVAGQADFQSPARMADQTRFGPELDRFPLLVLDLTLAALQRDPRLMGRRTPGDGLLLGQVDYAAPGRSALLATIEALPGMAGMVRVFRDACGVPLEHVPPLSVLRLAEHAPPPPQVRLAAAPRLQKRRQGQGRLLAAGGAGFVAGAGTMLAGLLVAGAVIPSPWPSRAPTPPAAATATGSPGVIAPLSPRVQSSTAAPALTHLTRRAVLMRAWPSEEAPQAELLRAGTRVRKLFSAEFGWDRVSVEIDGRGLTEGYVHDSDLAAIVP